MKKYFVFLFLLFVAVAQGVCANSIVINNTQTTYNYGDPITLNVAAGVLPGDFSKTPEKMTVRITLPANLSWSAIAQNIYSTTTVSISDIAFSNNVISFSFSNLYNGQPPIGTAFNFLVYNIYINSTAIPVCDDTQAQITATVSYFDNQNISISPANGISNSTYSFVVLKYASDIRVEYLNDNYDDYQTAKDIYYVDFYYIIYQAPAYTGINVYLQSNQTIVKIDEISYDNRLPVNVITPSYSGNTYVFSRDNYYYRSFRVYFKNIPTTGQAALQFKASVELVRTNVCNEPKTDFSFNRNFTMVNDPSALYSQPRIMMEYYRTGYPIDKCTASNPIKFSIDNTYNTLNTGFYAEIINPKFVEFNDLQFLNNLTLPANQIPVTSIKFNYCNNQTSTVLNSSGTFDFSSITKNNIDKITLYFANGIGAAAYLNATLDFKYNAAKTACGNDNFVFNIRKTTDNSIINTKTVNIGIQEPSTGSYVWVAPYDRAITPGESYSYTVYYQPGVNDNTNYEVHFSKTNHLNFDRTTEPLFALEDGVFKTRLQFNADNHSTLEYTYTTDGTQIIIKGMYFPPTLSGCYYSTRLVQISVPVKVIDKPVSNTYTQYVSLQNGAINLYNYSYNTRYVSTEKINGNAAVSCNNGTSSNVNVTVTQTDGFWAILTGENGSGNSYTGVNATFIIDLPKTGIDYIHNSLVAKMYDGNNVYESTLATVPYVTYLTATNVENTLIQSASTKVKVIFNGISISAYEKLQLTLGFPSSPDYSTTSSIAFDFMLSTLTVTSNDATITIGPKSSCDLFDCKECLTSFSPLPGDYIVSGWVKEAITGSRPDAYKNSGIEISFNDGTTVLPLFRPDGAVVDGWQRIEASFTVLSTYNNIHVTLVNQSATTPVFFDDIRVHPYNSNMKSFVYDPSTQKLVAELDENNYATLYEYDDEGILIRVKKETERGVMTIKETRSNQSKVQKSSITE